MFGTKLAEVKSMSISDPAWLVLARFPEQWESIMTLLAQSDEFRALCGDYTKAMETLRRWRNSSMPVAPTRVQEYQGLAAKLEVEIERFLQGYEERRISKSL